MDIQQHKKRIKHEQNLIALREDIENEIIDINSISQDILNCFCNLIADKKREHKKKSLLGTSLRNER